MYRLLAIDLDGTLLNPSHRITPRTLDVLQRAMDSDVQEEEQPTIGNIKAQGIIARALCHTRVALLPFNKRQHQLYSSIEVSCPSTQAMHERHNMCFKP
ncbi:HAD family hydrolase [Dictyobacter formicarum]|uniref:Sucrose phosphatase-like domain-containing protein n=1 Tax=Dictyobacter formicarum TaxID=2778368 RepID=A0ABQ3VPT8_9CHLR|nr:HAD hydrolase family protein [Dictyobacter formicarum]GHO87386.1 hypothetical protein KSZ_53920 [Dictyobacter formicarum]